MRWGVHCEPHEPDRDTPTGTSTSTTNSVVLWLSATTVRPNQSQDTGTRTGKFMLHRGEGGQWHEG